MELHCIFEDLQKMGLQTEPMKKVIIPTNNLKTLLANSLILQDGWQKSDWFGTLKDFQNQLVIPY